MTEIDNLRRTACQCELTTTELDNRWKRDRSRRFVPANVIRRAPRDFSFETTSRLVSLSPSLRLPALDSLTCVFYQIFFLNSRCYTTMNFLPLRRCSKLCKSFFFSLSLYIAEFITVTEFLCSKEQAVRNDKKEKKTKTKTKTAARKSARLSDVTPGTSRQNARKNSHAKCLREMCGFDPSPGNIRWKSFTYNAAYLDWMMYEVINGYSAPNCPGDYDFSAFTSLPRATNKHVKAVLNSTI